jgi:hypothetical protein
MKEIFREYIKTVIKIFLPILYTSNNVSPNKSIIGMVLLFISSPIVIILLSTFFPHSLGLQILIVILSAITGLLITFTLLTVVSLVSQIKGAEIALQKPPPSGETSIRVTDNDEVIFEGKKFPYAPKSPDDQATTSVDFNLSPKPPYGLPTKKRQEWVKWKKLYSIIKPMITEGKSWSEITTELELNYPDLPSSIDTLSNIEKAGNDGLLDTWPPDWENSKTPD